MLGCIELKLHFLNFSLSFKSTNQTFLSTKSFHLATETQMCYHIKPLCTHLEKSSLDPDSLVELMVTGQTPKLFPVQNYIRRPVDFCVFMYFVLQEWEKKSEEFVNFKKAQEMHEECKGLNLGALLITPVQRVPRLGYIHFCTKFPTPLCTIATCSTIFFLFFKGAVANIKSGL